MSWQLSVYLLPLVFATGISVVLAIVVGRRSEPLARTFAVLMLAIATWAFTAALGLASTTFDAQVLWNRTEFFGAVVAPTAWLLLVVQYAGYDAWVTRRTVGALSVEPALTLAFVWTNASHHLVWHETTRATVSGMDVLEQVAGPWYWFNLGYSYLLVVAGLALLLKVYLQSNSLYRRQSAVLVFGAAVPLGANVAFNFGFTSFPVDLTAFSFSISGTLVAFALFYFDLLDLKPVARDVLVEEMANPVVVVDAEGRIVDTNGAARQVLAPDLGHGEPVPPALAVDPDSNRDAYTATVDGRTRTYRVQRTTLSDHRNEVVGSIVVMDDVTDLRSHEERLAVLNRVLRHNVRNELTVVLGHLGEIADRLPDDRSVETARKHAERVVDLSEQTRDVIETLDGERGEPTRVDAGGVVERVADEFRETHPDVEIDSEIEAVQAIVATADLLAVAVTNLIENAIKHNERDEPTVRIECVPDGELVRLSVADDGPGIPAIERTVLVEGNETPLHHGSGLGLWLVHWIVTICGGELRFEENVPRGSVVTAWLERAPDEP